MLVNHLEGVNIKKINVINNSITKFTAIADYGCTSHFFPLAPKICSSVRQSDNNVKVVLPNNDVITSQMEGFLPIEGVSQQAKAARLFPNI